MSELKKLLQELQKNGKDNVAKTIKAAADELAQKEAAKKSPLRKLDDDAKSDLLKMLTSVKCNMEDSLDALEELSRRMRYFDLYDTVKELGLDKVVKDMAKTQEHVSDASYAMYALTHGKKPTQEQMAQMADDFGFSPKKRSPYEFFKTVTVEDDEERDEEGDNYRESDFRDEEDLELENMFTAPGEEDECEHESVYDLPNEEGGDFNKMLVKLRDESEAEAEVDEDEDDDVEHFWSKDDEEEEEGDDKED